MVAFFMKETKPQEDMPASLAVRPRGISALGPVFKDSFFVKFLVVFTLIKIPTSMLFGLLPVYAKENFAIPESQVGLLMLTNGLTIVLLQYFVSSKVKRFDIMPILTVAGASWISRASWPKPGLPGCSAQANITTAAVITALGLVFIERPPSVRGLWCRFC